MILFRLDIFAHSVLQKINIKNEIIIAKSKVVSNKLTFGVFTNNFDKKMKNVVASDQELTFKGATAYWKKSFCSIF